MWPFWLSCSITMIWHSTQTESHKIRPFWMDLAKFFHQVVSTHNRTWDILLRSHTKALKMILCRGTPILIKCFIWTNILMDLTISRSCSTLFTTLVTTSPSSHIWRALVSFLFHTLPIKFTTFKIRTVVVCREQTVMLSIWLTSWVICHHIWGQILHIAFKITPLTLISIIAPMKQFIKIAK